MPEIGEIRKDKEIGKKGSSRYVWQACANCGKERWVGVCKGQVRNKICLVCSRASNFIGGNLAFGGFEGHHHSEDAKAKIGLALRGERNYRWKGGSQKTKAGYIFIRLYPDDFFYPMANSSGRVFEHRLVVAKALGRCLHLWEIVHHKKGYAKDDNRYPETLQLVTDDRHKQISILERKIKHLEARVTLLEAENIFLNRGVSDGTEASKVAV